MVRLGFFVMSLVLAQDPAIRVATRLVQVNVVVRDGHGPVAGLAKKDFKIFDKGKERTLALFSVSSAAADKTPAKLVSAPPGVFTNRVPAREGSPFNATILLIDVLNTGVSDQQAARQQLLKFLSTLDPNRRVAIYLLGTRLHVLQDFTSDRRILAQAAKFRGEPSTPLGASNMPLPGDAVHASEEMGTGMTGNPAEAVAREALAEMRDAATVDRVSVTLSALEQIANHVARVPGRKTLIWISGSFPFFLIDDERHNFLAANRENRTFHLEIERANQTLSAADTAIYPIDARGLLGSPEADGTEHSNGFTNPRGRAFGTRKNGQIGAMAVDTPEGLDSMQALAEGTGGRAFFNTNYIQGAIGKAFSDADLTYTLGFYADAAADGFHEIQVKVDRPGLDVRYRKGYLAAPPKTPAEEDVVALLRNAVASSLDATGIGLIAAADGPRIGLHVNFADLALEKQDGKWTGAIDVVYVAESAGGRRLGLTSKRISLDLNDDVYAAKTRAGLVVDQIVDRPKDTARIRIAVLDERSGATGSVSILLGK